MKNKKAIFILVILGLVIVGMVWGYMQIQKESEVKEIVNGQKKAELVSGQTALPAVEEKNTELIGTQKIVCGNETYIFDLILNEVYFNNIYKNERSPGNLIIHEKATGKEGAGALYVLGIPSKNCDRIYLSRFTPESDAPFRKILEFSIKENTINELAIGKKFSGVLTPFNIRNSVSPDGKKMLITGPGAEQFCDFRSLYLLYLNEDRSKVLVQLPNTQAFTSDNMNDGVIGYCLGLSFGWLDESTIYYDVYDATVDFSRPLIERRTLRIE